MTSSGFEFEQAPQQRRGHVVRMALFYSILASISGVLVLIAIIGIATGDGGLVVMLFVFGIVGLLTGVQARHYLRDLAAAPVAIEGPILRKWHKGNLFVFFMPSYYLLVEDKIFSIRRKEYGMLLEDDVVRIYCYPHSLTVERLERYDTSAKRYLPATTTDGV